MRTGCSAARLVITMNTPWHASLAYLLDVGVNVDGIEPDAGQRRAR